MGLGIAMVIQLCAYLLYNTSNLIHFPWLKLQSSLLMVQGIVANVTGICHYIDNTPNISMVWQQQYIC